MSVQEPNARPNRDVSRGVVWFWLTCMIVAGAALRLSRIGAEAVDHEEYVSLCHLGAPGLIAFLKLVKGHYPFSAPLPFAFEYLWSRIAGTSPAQVRLLFVLVGTLIIPAAYGLTSAFYRGLSIERRAGLVAALCVTLSPVYVFQAQEARQYPFLVLFGACSMYTFLRGLRGGGAKWWWLNGVANLCVIWTHLFGVVLPFTEGVFLSCCVRGHIRRLLAWGTGHVALLVPMGFWLATIHVPMSDNIYSSYGKPTWQQWLWDIVADDVIYLSRVFPAVSPNAWQWAPSGLRAEMLAVRPWFGWALAALLGIVTVWAVWKALRGRSPGRRDWFLLLAWLIVPVLLLVGLSYAWKPCYGNRYTAYGALALYVAIGGMLGSIPHAVARRCHVAGVAALYVYQLSLSLPGPTRTDWHGVAAHIEAAGTAGDLILIEDPFWTDEFKFNEPGTPNPVSDAYERGQLCTEARFFLEQCALSADETARNRGAWILLVDIGMRGGNDLEQCLRADGLEFTSRDFPGERRVIAYRVRRGPKAVAPEAVPPIPSLPMDVLADTLRGGTASTAVSAFRESIRYLPDFSGGAAIRQALALAERGVKGVTVPAFDRAVRINPELGLQLAVMIGDIMPEALRGKAWEAARLLGQGRPADAVGAAREACNAMPTDPFPCWLLWRAQLNAGDMDGAMSAIRAAYERDAALSPGWSPLFAPVCSAMNAEQSQQVIEQLKAAGLPLPSELIERFQKLPRRSS